MSFGRRLQLFAIGLVIGGLLAWFSFGERLTNAAWTPRERIRKRLSATLVKATPSATQALAAWPAQLTDVRSAVPASTILLDRLRRSGDSLFYTIQFELGGRLAEAIVLAHKDHRHDSTATLWSLGPAR